MMTLESKPEGIQELWHCNDNRLPLNSEITRIPPDSQFIQSVRENGVIQDPAVGYNDQDGWFLICGRKRLLTVRLLVEEGTSSGDMYFKVFYGVTKEEAHYLSIIENGQRSDNAISDYYAIRAIFEADNTVSYKSIAKTVGKPVTYISNLDEVYGKAPKWALEAAMDDKIADSVLKELAKSPVEYQKKAKEYFNEHKDGKNPLPKRILQNMRRLQKQEFAVGFAQVSPAFTMKRPLIPRREVEMLAAIANDGGVPTSKRLSAIKDELERLLAVEA